MSVTQSTAASFETLETTVIERPPLQDITQMEDNPLAKNKEIKRLENIEVDQEIEQALLALSIGDFHSRWDSAKQFVKRFKGDRAAPQLIYQLQRTQDPEYQWFLVRMLGQYDQPTVVETLAQFLVTTPEAELQAEAIKSLTALGDRAISTLSEQLRSGALPQRRLAAQALSRIRRSAVIMPFLSVARDADSQLRLVAIEALGSFHDPRITPALISALTDTDEIAAEAIRALGRRSDLLADHDLIGRLGQCLDHPSETVAKEAAIALGRLGTEEGAIALGTCLTQPAPTAVKVAAVRALSWLDSAIATVHLATAFECAPPVVMPAVKQEIAKALGQTRSAANKITAAKPLVRWLQQTNSVSRLTDNLQPDNRQSDNPMPDEQSLDEQLLADFSLKQAVISSLTWLGATDALESLIPLLADSDPRIQMHALSALKQIDPRDAEASVRSFIKRRSLDPSAKAKLTSHLSSWQG